ncbi:2-histidine synthase subunit 2 [Golovinomyces cichoracearum]|uniref:2-(3-amino-3-carboxypropyl)histidine synthase subunit 2 n=1 Tax=Golovinomyces cichoracearum TaxID=62708 RepID=A0A420IRP0_9PEZI|nr:2-histidine synthase subunit 2 [Golovinomyces cichoracearum]
MTNAIDKDPILEDVTLEFSNSFSLNKAPILSTPEHHDFGDPKFRHDLPSDVKTKKRKTKEYIWHKYEINRTAKELLAGGWKTVAMQFSDDMLEDVWAVVKELEVAVGQIKSIGENPNVEKSCASKVSSDILRNTEFKTCLPVQNTKNVEGLNESGENIQKSIPTEYDNTGVQMNIAPDDGLLSEKEKENGTILRPRFTKLGDGGLESDFNTGNEATIVIPKPMFRDLGDGGLETDITNLVISSSAAPPTENKSSTDNPIKFFVLADTSYGSCCIDEIAAQHCDAQVIIHYGRSCLSPTTRLPIIYVFTATSLDINSIIQSFEKNFDKKNTPVILMADIMFHNHIKTIQKGLEDRGYTDIIAPEVVHDPASRIPNREIASEIALEEYSLFHVSEPPPALILTLNSRVKDMCIYSTSLGSSPCQNIRSTTRNLIRRRYALLNSLNNCSIFGILINTLSVAHNLDALESIQALISAAGKKHYTFVVGKVNAAKMANFSEIGGWVAISCWESSLLESKEFYKPVITPWELEWVLTSDKVRVWNGDWRGDFGAIGEKVKKQTGDTDVNDDRINLIEDNIDTVILDAQDSEREISETDSESESEPPEFDLRTGRYVSHSRPMQKTISRKTRNSLHDADDSTTSKVLARRAPTTVATVGGEASPGAEFLRSKRTWTGLGSDFLENDTSNLEVEMGTFGIARRYVVNDKKQ